MKLIIKLKSFFNKILNNFFKKNLFTPKSILNYMYTTESLPTPLTLEEESELVLLFQNNSDLDAKSKLIEHNLRLVLYIAKKFEGNKLDIQDLVSVGSIGLIKAVDSYKLDKNIKLATYASRCIENEILMFLRKANKNINDLSLDDGIVSDDEGNSLSLSEIIPDEKLVTDEIELEDEKSYLIKAIEKLNKREQTIMFMRYGLNGYDELTQKEVADQMNISQSYISRLEKKIIHRLKIDLSSNIQ